MDLEVTQKIEEGDWIIVTLTSANARTVDRRYQNMIGKFYEVTEIFHKLDGGTFYDCINLDNKISRITTISTYNYNYQITKVPKGNLQALKVLYGVKGK
jgi:hypothetical protein